MEHCATAIDRPYSFIQALPSVEGDARGILPHALAPIALAPLGSPRYRSPLPPPLPPPMDAYWGVHPFVVASSHSDESSLAPWYATSSSFSDSTGNPGIDPLQCGNSSKAWPTFSLAGRAPSPVSMGIC